MASDWRGEMQANVMSAINYCYFFACISTDVILHCIRPWEARGRKERRSIHGDKD